MPVPTTNNSLIRALQLTSLRRRSRRRGTHVPQARRIEQQSLRAYEEARHRLEDAARAARQLSEARTAQERRQSWLRDHPGTRRWIEQLEGGVAVREYELACAEAGERQVTRDGRAERHLDAHA